MMANIFCWFAFGFTCFGVGVMTPDWVEEHNNKKDANRGNGQRLN